MSRPENIRERVVTRYGRVVYERKKHVFTVKDLIRISKNIAPKFVDGCLPEDVFTEIVTSIYDQINPPEPEPLLGWFDLPLDVGEPDTPVGGAGAGGSFGYTAEDFYAADGILLMKCSLLEEN